MLVFVKVKCEEHRLRSISLAHSMPLSQYREDGIFYFLLTGSIGQIPRYIRREKVNPKRDRHLLM